MINRKYFIFYIINKFNFICYFKKKNNINLKIIIKKCLMKMKKIKIKFHHLEKT